jgi:hypothetical protein
VVLHRSIECTAFIRTYGDVTHVQQTHKAGTGVISMKLCGEGVFNKDDRQAAMRFAFRNASVDGVTAGYKNNAEIDEAIENLNQALE